MVDLKQFNEALTRYVRPQTYPVAVKMCSSLDEIPERAQFPKRDRGSLMPVCQMVGLSRRYGISMAAGIDDMNCPGAMVTLGLVPAKKRYLEGEFASSSVIPKEAHARSSKLLPRLEHGRYKYVVTAPIHRAKFDTDVVIIYGFPAQIALLTQASGFQTGEPIRTPIASGGFCAPIIAGAMLTAECQVELPCAGDRAFGSAQDYELGFSAPQSKLEQLVVALESLWKSGMYRIPIITNLDFEANFPESYKQAIEYLTQEGE